MADEPQEPLGADADAPATPAKAAADKSPSQAPGEPLKGEVSRTDAPGAGASAAPQARRAEHPAPKPGNPAAATTATTSEHSSAIDGPSAPGDNDEGGADEPGDVEKV